MAYIKASVPRKSEFRTVEDRWRPSKSSSGARKPIDYRRSEDRSAPKPSGGKRWYPRKEFPKAADLRRKLQHRSIAVTLMLPAPWTRTPHHGNRPITKHHQKQKQNRQKQNQRKKNNTIYMNRNNMKIRKDGVVLLPVIFGNQICVSFALNCMHSWCQPAATAEIGASLTKEIKFSLKIRITNGHLHVHYQS